MVGGLKQGPTTSLAICGCVRIAAVGSLFPAAVERRVGAVSGRNTLHGALKHCMRREYIANMVACD